MRENKVSISPTANEFMEDFKLKQENSVNACPQKVKESRKKNSQDETVTQRVCIQLTLNQMTKISLLQISLRKILPELIDNYLEHEDQKNKIKNLLKGLQK